MAGNKNTYLDRQRERDQKFLDAGERMGIQKMWDYMQIALREEAVVGKDVFGRKRLEKLFTGPRSWPTTSTRPSRMTRRLTWSREIWMQHSGRSGAMI